MGLGERLEGGKGMGKQYNYTIISRNKNYFFL